MVGWGPGACPGCLLDSQRGQAPGPHIRPTAPLVPTHEVKFPERTSTRPPALIHTSPSPYTWEKPSRCKPWRSPRPSFTDPVFVSLTQAGQHPPFSPPVILVVEPARPLPIHSSLPERKLSMTSHTHPDPFPTLPPPHACMVKLNHTKIIPSKMRGICTLSQLYQCRLSVD